MHIGLKNCAQEFPRVRLISVFECSDNALGIEYYGFYVCLGINSFLELFTVNKFVEGF